MKNSIKTGLAALAIAISFIACGGDASKTPVDSAKTNATKIDSAKLDSAKTLAADSATAVLSDSTKK